MEFNKKMALAALLILCVYLLSAEGFLKIRGEKLIKETVAEESVNADVQETQPQDAETAPVQAQSESGQAEQQPTPEEEPAEEEEISCEAETEPLRAVMETVWDEEIRETCIQGGLSIKNATSYEIDVREMLSQKPGIVLPEEGPQILIIHTHGSEAYTQAGLDHYESNDDHRTANKEFNIIRIGDELTKIFEEAGLRVIHDREIYDYPSYTGSYRRSGEAVEKYLEQYPDIAVVLDVHRDALGANGVVYKTMAEEKGVCASQIMLLAGSDNSGLYHPDWKTNLSLALYLQNAVTARHPSLMRPVSLVRERYNQQLTKGSLIIEVGSSGNTLQEALAAIRLFGDAAAPALCELNKQLN